jgi:hypothetical protein
MRFTVHAEQSRGPVEFHRATAFEAITTGWELMDAGATVGAPAYVGESPGLVNKLRKRAPPG